MKKKTVLVIGILGILLIFGAAVALAQNTSSEKTKEAEKHKCTPEMMKDMSKNCPEQMMKSGEGEKMMDGEKGHSGMMGNENPAGENTDTAGENHCGDKNSDMSSMMGSSSNADVRGMM